MTIEVSHLSIVLLLKEIWDFARYFYRVEVPIQTKLAQKAAHHLSMQVVVDIKKLSEYF